MVTCPLVLRHHIYSVIDSRSEVDSEVRRLLALNALREFRLPFSFDAALARATDFEVLVKDSIAALPPGMPADALTWFSTSVVPVCRTPGVGMAVLAPLFERWRGAQYSSGSVDVATYISALVRAGFLRPRAASTAGLEVIRIGQYHFLSVCHSPLRC
jgi:hypothetical protein